MKIIALPGISEWDCGYFRLTISERLKYENFVLPTKPDRLIVFTMNKKLDQIFCGLMALAAMGHLFGTFKFAEFGTGLFVWSLSGVLAAALLTAMNILRNRRSGDKILARITLVGNLAWVGIVTLFAQSIGNYFDPRVLFHGIAAIGLSYFSLQSLRG
jgi:hypothetical protein